MTTEHLDEAERDCCHALRELFTSATDGLAQNVGEHEPFIRAISGLIRAHLRSAETPKGGKVDIPGDFVTLERAKIIRTWRVDLGCTWGRVAELFDAVWRGVPGGAFGAWLCGEAARLLGEDPTVEPWNEEPTPELATDPPAIERVPGVVGMDGEVHEISSAGSGRVALEDVDQQRRSIEGSRHGATADSEKSHAARATETPGGNAPGGDQVAEAATAQPQPEPGGRVADGDEEGANALLQAVRDVGPSGGTMVEFPFEELHKRVAEAVKKAHSEGYEAGKAKGGEGEATDEELRSVRRVARTRSIAPPGDAWTEDMGERDENRALYNLGIEHGKRTKATGQGEAK